MICTTFISTELTSKETCISGGDALSKNVVKFDTFAEIYHHTYIVISLGKLKVGFDERCVLMGGVSEHNVHEPLF